MNTKKKHCINIILILILTMMLSQPAFAAGQIRISGTISKPSGTLVQGKGFSVSGEIISTSKLKNVFVAVYSLKDGKRDGKEVLKHPIMDINTTKYNLSNTTLKFETLSPGEYEYVVAARDVNDYRTEVISSKFTVVKSSSFQLTGSIQKPSGTLIQGSTFKLAGTVNSTYDIKNVFVAVYKLKNGSRDGDPKTQDTTKENVNAKKYDLANMTLEFENLVPGEYEYVVAARDVKGYAKDIGKSKFTVKNDSEVSISNYNKPGTITEGSQFNLKGTLKSKYDIKNVYVAVLSGKTTVKSDTKPDVKSTTFELSNLKLPFNELAPGQYRYVVSVRDKFDFKKDVLSVDFTVVKASKFWMNNKPSIGTIIEGSDYALSGTIESNYDMVNVVAQIFNSDGTTLIKESAVYHPNATTYNAASIKAPFSSLSAGTYCCKIHIRDAKDKVGDAFTCNFTVKKNNTLYYPMKNGISVSSKQKKNGYNCDYTASSGTPIYAPTSGTVSFKQTTAQSGNVRKMASYGNWIEFISSDGKWKVLCCHLSSFNGVSSSVTSSFKYPCSASQYSCSAKILATKSVSSRALLGYSGKTGNASGPHVHIEVYEKVNGNWKARNPSSVFTTWK